MVFPVPFPTLTPMLLHFFILHGLRRPTVPLCLTNRFDVSVNKNNMSVSRSFSFLKPFEATVKKLVQHRQSKSSLLYTGHSKHGCGVAFCSINEMVSNAEKTSTACLDCTALRSRSLTSWLNWVSSGLYFAVSPSQQ